MSKYQDAPRPKTPVDTEKFNAKSFDNQVDIKALDTLIYKQGIAAEIYQILPCPNVKAIDSKEHQLSCPICYGKGYIDVSPEQTIVLFHSNLKNMELNKEKIETNYEEGTAYITLLSGINLNFFQKIVLSEFAGPSTEILQRGEGDIDRPRYFITKINSVIIDSNNQIYLNNTDFAIENGNIKWIGKRPNRGTPYSVGYDSPKTFRATAAIHRSRYSGTGFKMSVRQGQELQEQWQIKEIGLAEANGEDGKPLIKTSDIFPVG